MGGNDSVSTSQPWTDLAQVRDYWRALVNAALKLKEIVINTRNWADLAQVRDYWRALVNAAFKLQEIVINTRNWADLAQDRDYRRAVLTGVEVPGSISHGIIGFLVEVHVHSICLKNWEVQEISLGDIIFGTNVKISRIFVKN